MRRRPQPRWRGTGPRRSRAGAGKKIARGMSLAWDSGSKTRAATVISPFHTRQCAYRTEQTARRLSRHAIARGGRCRGGLGGLLRGPRAMVTFYFRRRISGDKTLSVDESLKTRIEELVRAGTVRRKLAAAQLEAEIRRREEVLRRTFRRYLSPRLADKILEDAQLRDTLLSTADLRAHAVVLFADLRGLTTISERLAPSQVVPLLNAYFSLLTEITFRHAGTVFHMAGDCLMLGF